MLPSALQLGWQAGLVAVALWRACPSQTAGDATDGTSWGDAFAMTGWGLVTMLPAIALAFPMGWTWWPLLAAGVALGPVYALGGGCPVPWSCPASPPGRPSGWSSRSER